ncbi:MAG: hypothetical protein Q8K75_06825 [Chlamydiales bacterium]|nr:hypothetical protein [Chlamydiales bacterium]
MEHINIHGTAPQPSLFIRIIAAPINLVTNLTGWIFGARNEEVRERPILAAHIQAPMSVPNPNGLSHEDKLAQAVSILTNYRDIRPFADKEECLSVLLGYDQLQGVYEDAIQAVFAEPDLQLTTDAIVADFAVTYRLDNPNSNSRQCLTELRNHVQALSPEQLEDGICEKVIGDVYRSALEIPAPPVAATQMGYLVLANGKNQTTNGGIAACSPLSCHYLHDAPNDTLSIELLENVLDTYAARYKNAEPRDMDEYVTAAGLVVVDNYGTDLLTPVGQYSEYGMMSFEERLGDFITSPNEQKALLTSFGMTVSVRRVGDVVEFCDTHSGGEITKQGSGAFLYRCKTLKEAMVYINARYTDNVRAVGGEASQLDWRTVR